MIQKASDNVMVKLNDVSSNVVLQPIIQAFVDIQSFQDNLEGLLQANASNDRIVQELDEYIKKYKRINPHQQIANHASQLETSAIISGCNGQLINPRSKGLGNGVQQTSPNSCYRTVLRQSRYQNSRRWCFLVKMLQCERRDF